MNLDMQSWVQTGARSNGECLVSGSADEPAHDGVGSGHVIRVNVRLAWSNAAVSEQKYTIRVAEDGNWSVYNVETDQVVVVDGKPQVGMKIRAGRRSRRHPEPDCA
jgi:hypothetical protein